VKTHWCVLEEVWAMTQSARRNRGIKLRPEQPTVREGRFADEVAELWEPWMGLVYRSFCRIGME
jgi:hypothetical protein